MDCKIFIKYHTAVSKIKYKENLPNLVIKIDFFNFYIDNSLKFN